MVSSEKGYMILHLLHEKEVQGEQKKYNMKKYKQGEVGGGGKSLKIAKGPCSLITRYYRVIAIITF